MLIIGIAKCAKDGCITKPAQFWYLVTQQLPTVATFFVFLFACEISRGLRMRGIPLKSEMQRDALPPVIHFALLFRRI
jgi:hypothetical protein